MIFDPSRIEWTTAQANDYVYIHAEYMDDMGYRFSIYNGVAEAGNEEQIYACKHSLTKNMVTIYLTQKTAWFMLHRLREAMKTRTARKFRGTIEGDETFVGGRAKNMHAHKREAKITGRGAVGKAIVQGLLKRGEGKRVSEFRGMVVGNTEEWSLCPNIYRNVANGAKVFTDAAPAYGSLAIRYVHQFIDHATRYVEGLVHVNGVENFWSLLKRMLHGTYVAVANFHLQRYVDEEAFRYNERDTNDAGRFAELLLRVVGRRLTYRRLTAQGDAGFMGIR